MAIVFIANPVWPCEELSSAAAKASARWMRAIVASLRSPKMKQKITSAMFSRLFIKNTTKKIYVTLYSACLQLLFIIFEFLPPGVLNVTRFVGSETLGTDVWWACLILGLN